MADQNDMMSEMVSAVKKHASEHYSRGWDNVVECFSDKDIATELAKGNVNGWEIKTVAQALTHFTWLVDLWRQYEDNVMCQSGEHLKCAACGHWYYAENFHECDGN